MMYQLVSILFILPLLVSSCQDGKISLADAGIDMPYSNDHQIKEKPVVEDPRLDSMVIESFILEEKIDLVTAERIRSFYKNRDFQFAWLTRNGLTEQAQAFWNMHNEYVTYSRDSSIYDKDLHETIGALLEEDVNLHQNEMVHTELHLTNHFFDYSKYAFSGRVNPEELQWHIPRKKVDPLALLDSLMNSQPGDLKSWAPQSKQYLALKSQLKKYESLQKKLNGSSIDLGNAKFFEEGDSSIMIRDLKNYLFLLGDLKENDGSFKYNKTLKAAVMEFQERHGLTPDGVIGTNTLKEINTPLNRRIEQMLINMERLRWLPERPAGTSIVANIPEYRVHVYEDRQKALSMDIVIGKAANRTVIFKDDLEYVVFSPYWNVPRSIVRNEIQPALQTNSDYLSRNNMEITGYSNGLPVVRQKPGAGNALGKVKFIFPNRYNIYFHDTPAKSLFSRTHRAFSHGCIRLEDPFKFAQYLLQHEASWTSERISEAMNSGNEKWVKLDQKIPVMIVYLTAWVGDDGVLQFRRDIYGHDKKLADQLFTTGNAYAAK
jgi:murein L,D-transpeptidase YcbB/YkuD